MALEVLEVLENRGDFKIASTDSPLMTVVGDGRPMVAHSFPQTVCVQMS